MWKTIYMVSFKSYSRSRRRPNEQHTTKSIQIDKISHYIVHAHTHLIANKSTQKNKNPRVIHTKASTYLGKLISPFHAASDNPNVSITY